MKTLASIRSSEPSVCALPVLLALLGAACQDAQTHELGFTQSARELSAEALPEPTERFFTSYDDFVGRWVGEADAALALAPESDGTPPPYRFPSGSTRFALEIEYGLDDYGQTTLLGTLTFGEGAAPAPPSDPDLGYPVGTNYAALLSYGNVEAWLPNNLDLRLPPFEAFAYSVITATQIGDPLEFGSFPGAADGVLPLRFSTNEILDDWCQLQAPALNVDGVYTPFPADTGSFESRGDGTNAVCDIYAEHDLNCPPGVDLTDAEILGCIDPDPPVIAQVSCDWSYLAPYCACVASGCRAYGVEHADETNTQLLVRRVGDSLVGAFRNEIFLNARNLTVPLGQVRFELD